MKKLIIVIFAVILSAAIRIPAQEMPVVVPVDTASIVAPLPAPGVIEIPVRISTPPLQPLPVVLPRRINAGNWVSPYALPYTPHSTGAEWHRMWVNTAVLSGAFIGTLFVLELLPEDATAWNRAAISEVPMFKRWFRNVFKLGPNWDGDSWIFNFIMHPYAGAVYFMSARSSGFNFWGSMLYSAAISTVFWEFGIEAFMERPSIQDIFVTPLVGSLIGEGFYRLKRNLVRDDYRICGSPVLGGVVAFLIDPVNEMLGLFTGNPARAEAARQRGLRSSILPATVAGAPGFTFSCTF